MKIVKFLLACLSVVILVFRQSQAATDPGIEFRENKGQWAPEILYRAELSNGYLFVTKKGLSYILFQHNSFKNFPDQGDNLTLSADNNRRGPEQNKVPINIQAFKLHFAGMSDEPEIIPGGKKKTYYNYFTGSDSAKWAHHVSAYGEIVYKDLYPGINFRIYSKKGYMEYDFIIKKGADLSRLKYYYSGIDSIKKEFNNLYISTAIGKITENSPYAYQLHGRDTVRVPCHFKLKGNEINFDFPKGYNRKYDLIIDPLLVFSTYSGSTMDNWGNTATFDKYGNVYSGGTVWDYYGGSLPVDSGAFQSTFGGVWDVALLKFDSTGKNLIYGTYLGGSDSETPLSLIVNNKNELVILGITGSSDFPVTTNAYSKQFSGGDTVTNALGIYNGVPFFGVAYMHGSDFFISKLSEDGSELIASTYLGGSRKEGINNAQGLPLSRNYGDEFRGEVNIDNSDNIYVVSNTSSPDFPIVNGFQKEFGGGMQDGIVAKLSPDLSALLWSTFLGGKDLDAAYSIKISDGNYVVVAGGTMSNDFPVTTGAYHTGFGGDVDGFIARISDDGQSLLSSTYVGTSGYDQIYFTDLDKNENIYAYGQTDGNYPVSDSVYHNPNSGQFIQKFSKDLSTSVFSTVIGSGSGSPDISPTAFLVNDCGNIFLSGWGGRINHYITKYVGGYTTGMPVTNDAFQSTTDGSDFYLMVLSENAKDLLYATFLGAVTSREGEHVDGGTSRFDKRGIVYHAICACRDNSQFPTTPGVWSNANNCPQGCNNGVFKFDLASLKARFGTNNTTFDNPGITSGCYPFDVVFLNRSIGGKVFQWYFGDGTSKVQRDSVFHEYTKPGSYVVSLYAYDENTCQQHDIATSRIRVFESHFSFPPDTTICQGTRVQLIAGGAVKFNWSPAYGLNDPAVSAPIASPDSSITYTLNMSDEHDCKTEDSVRVTVIPSVKINFKTTLLYDCKSRTKVELSNSTENADRFLWDLGDGNFSDEKEMVYQYADTGNYIIRLYAYGGNTCSDSANTRVHISKLFTPNVITPNNDNRNDRFVINFDQSIKLNVLNRWGEPVFHSDNYLNNWDAKGLPAGVYYYELDLDKNTRCNGWVEVLK